MEKLCYVKGVNGQVTLYEDRVIIERKGIMGFITQGLAGSKTIPLSSIQSVQFKEGGAFINGYIQFGVMGGKEGLGGVLNATQDENTVMLERGKQSDIGRQIKDYVEQAITERSRPQQANQISAADEILKLKQLLDAGILTQAEFDAKKKQLLGI